MRLPVKLVVTTVAAALVSSAAFAADAVYSYDSVPAAPAVQAQQIDWSGAYAGVNAGYAGGKAKAYVSGTEVGGLTGSGFVGGAQAGYNFQSGQVVYGVETDIQYSNVKAEAEILGNKAGVKHKWVGTTRARVGYTPSESVMVYGTGGVAYGKTKVYAGSDSLSKTKVGWAAGAGVEYAMDSNVSLKTEYLYTDLGKVNVEDLGSVKFKTHTVRAGVNYKF
jgi:outer membrane immunogenic protein